MIFFALVAVIMLGGVLLIMLPPLVQREGARRGVTPRSTAIEICRHQLRELDIDLSAGALARGNYDEARADIERRLLDELAAQEATVAPSMPRGGRSAAIAIGIALPLAAIGVYWAVGAPQALAPRAVAPSQSAHALDAPQVDAMIARLAAKLEREPEDAEGWAMLARSYSARRRFSEAAQAYAQAAARTLADAQLLADYADALAMAQGRRLQGEPELLIARALAANPNHVKALSLAGSAAYQKQEYATAVRHWQHILQWVPADADLARSIRASIADAQARLQAGAAPGPSGLQR